MARVKQAAKVAKDDAAAQGRENMSPNPPPSKDTNVEAKEWEVEEIFAIKKMWKNLWVRAAWVGFGEDTTWYPVSDFKTSPHLLIDFYLEHPDAPGPPTQLLAWRKAWQAGEDNYEHFQSDKPMGPYSKAKFFKQLELEMSASRQSKKIPQSK